MVLPANAIVEALELSMNELVFAGREPRSSSSFIFLSAFLAFNIGSGQIIPLVSSVMVMMITFPVSKGLMRRHCKDRRYQLQSA